MVLLHKTLRSVGTKRPGALPSIAHHVKDNEGAVRELVFVLVRLGSPYGYISPPRHLNRVKLYKLWFTMMLLRREKGGWRAIIFPSNAQKNRGNYLEIISFR